MRSVGDRGATVPMPSRAPGRRRRFAGTRSPRRDPDDDAPFATTTDRDAWIRREELAETVARRRLPDLVRDQAQRRGRGGRGATRAVFSRPPAESRAAGALIAAALKTRAFLRVGGLRRRTDDSGGEPLAPSSSRFSSMPENAFHCAALAPCRGASVATSADERSSPRVPASPFVGAAEVQAHLSTTSFVAVVRPSESSRRHARRAGEAVVERRSRPKTVRAVSRNSACATRNPRSPRNGIFSSGLAFRHRLRRLRAATRVIEKTPREKTWHRRNPRHAWVSAMSKETHRESVGCARAHSTNECATDAAGDGAGGPEKK